MWAELRHARSTRSLISFLAQRAGHRRLVVVGLLMVGSSLTEGIGLLMLVPITQSISGEGIDWLGGWFSAIPLWAMLVAFVSLIFLRALLTYVLLNKQRMLGLITTRELRLECREAIMSAEWRWLSAQSGADHTAMIMGMAERIGAQTHLALMVLSGAATLGALLISALFISWPMTVMALALGLMTAVPLSALRMRGNKDGEHFERAYGALSHQVQQGVDHLRAARIAGAGAVLRDDYRRVTSDLAEIEQHYFRKVSQVQLIYQTVAAAVLALIVFIGLDMLSLTLSVLVPVLAIFARIVPIAGRIQQGIRSWLFCKPAIEKFLNFTEQARDKAEPSHEGIQPPHLRDTLEIRDLTVRFDTRKAPILDALTLSIPAGHTIAITGPSGSGKSTLGDIISGLLEADEGEVLVDGVVLKGAQRVAWRSRIAYVEQSPYIFDDSVRANLTWGRDDIEDKQILAALDQASAQFVLKLPEGLDTNVGETGRQLSGGERQRLALARALLNEPELLILDETTSALDEENEMAIHDTIKRLKQSCTIVILGHRTTLLSLADQVIDLAAIKNTASVKRGPAG